MDLYMSWACPLSAHGHWSVRPILQGPSGFIFILFSCPLHPFWSVIIEKKDQMGWRLKIYGLMVQGLWVDGSNDWVDGSNADVVSCTKIWQVVWKPLWRMTRVVLWLVFISDQSVASSSVHFSYKYQSLLFPFLHFQLKHIVKAQPSSLSDRLVHIVISTVDTLPSFAWFIRHWFKKLVSILFQRVLQIHFLF